MLVKFSKAFDKVPHGRLLEKLRELGVGDPWLSWIGDFLTGGSFYVKVSQSISHCYPVTNVLLRGSVFGLLLPFV